MKITFLGACGTVTGSKYLLTINNKKILIDCGLFQGLKDLRLRNWNKLPIEPSEVDAVILTHAHIDHSGYLPLFAKQGFNGPIYATSATRDLCCILLPDSGYLHEEDARRANKYGYSKHKPALPLYTRRDGEDVITQFKSIDFNKETEILSDIKITFHRAGHILGASFVEIKANGKTIVFSGDLGRTNDPIMNSPEQIKSANYIVIESTYGNKAHETSSPLDNLEKVINKTVKRGGTILMPAFAVGRTQNLLYYLYKLKLENKIPNIPIYVDSPMATSATKLLITHISEHKLDLKLCKKVCEIAKYINTPEESQELDITPMPKIIISASGMASGGRILHHLKVFAPNHKNSIIFTGFQAAGTRGEKIVSGAPDVKIHGQLFPMKAEVLNMPNMSAHIDYKETLLWLKQLKQKPYKIFITHGEPKASISLKEKIEADLNIKCEIPEYLDERKL